MEKKKSKTKKTALDAATFSPHYLWSEFRKIKWTKWRKHGSEMGLGQYLGDTILFVVFFALFSLLITWFVSMGLEAL